MAKDTREKILSAATQLIHRQGYNHTGLQEILVAAGVPKGSFYFYFKSKEDLALALVDHFMDFWLARADGVLGDSASPALTRLHRFFANFHDQFRANGFVGGCPVGNLGQEMGDLSQPLRESLSGAIDAMAGRVAGVLTEAQARGELAPGADATVLGYFIISSWQGALIRMKVCKCAEPLETFERIVFGRLLTG